MYANRISTQRTATLMETRKGAYLPAFAVLYAASDKKKTAKRATSHIFQCVAALLVISGRKCEALSRIEK